MAVTTDVPPAIPGYMLDPNAVIKDDAVRRAAEHTTTPTLVESGNRVRIPGEPLAFLTIRASIGKVCSNAGNHVMGVFLEME